VSSLVRPRNGGRPVSSSYSIAPNAYTSHAGPTSAGFPRACSGAMYAGVPTAAPDSVSRSASASSSTASPKSAILGNGPSSVVSGPL
jgi:hypothetical protein